MKLEDTILKAKNLAENFKFNEAALVLPELSNIELTSYIDHTNLAPTASAKQIEELCRDAIRANFKAVCMPPAFAKQGHGLLHGTNVLLCTVAGFPHGNSTTSSKAFEVAEYSKIAAEVDFVAPVYLIKQAKWSEVYHEFMTMREASSGVLKVIFETCLLNHEEIAISSSLACLAGIDYLKTSTGFSTSGASLEAVALLAAVAAGKQGVKASGGIKTREDALKMIAAGATRIGTSNGKAIAGF